MPEKYKRSLKRKNINSGKILFFVFFVIILCGISGFLFWPDIQNYLDNKAKKINETDAALKLIQEDAKLYDETEKKMKINNNKETHMRDDDYDKKDRDYLNKKVGNY